MLQCHEVVTRLRLIDISIKILPSLLKFLKKINVEKYLYVKVP